MKYAEESKKKSGSHKHIPIDVRIWYAKHGSRSVWLGAVYVLGHSHGHTLNFFAHFHLLIMRFLNDIIYIYFA